MNGNMLCETTKDITKLEEDKWVAEFKEDGCRCVYNKGRFKGRSQNSQYTKKIPELESHLPAILDGELVYENDKLERYNRYLVVMSRLRVVSEFDIKIQSKISPLKFKVFDILELNGEDLRDKPLMERKEILNNLEFDNPNFEKVEYSTEIENVLFTAKERKYEGIILKKMDSTYQPRRSQDWLKFKFNIQKVIEVVEWEDNSDESITAISKKGIRTKINKPDCDNIKKQIEDKGKAKITIEFLDTTDSGKVRFPIYKGVVIWEIIEH